MTLVIAGLLALGAAASAAPAPVLTPQLGHPAGVSEMALRVSEDGARLLSIADGVGIVWDLTAEAELRRGPAAEALALEGYQDLPVEGLRSADGFVWLEGADGRVSLAAPAAPLVGSAASPGGERVFTGHADGEIWAFDARTGAVEAHLRGRAEPAYHAEIAEDGAHLLVAGEGSAAAVWDLATGAVLRVTKRRGAWGPLGFAPEGVVVPRPEGAVAVLDRASGAPIASLAPGESRTAGIRRPVAYQACPACGADIPDALWSAVAWAADHGVRSGNWPQAPLGGGRVWPAPGPAGARWLVLPEVGVPSLLTARAEGGVLVPHRLAAKQEYYGGREVPRGGPRARLEVPDGAAFGPRGEWLAVRHGDRTRVWDVAAAEIVADLQGAPWPVAVSPAADGIVVSGEAPSLWSRRGHLQRVFAPVGRALRSLAVSADGAWLTGAADDGTTHLWRMDTGAHVATLVVFADGGWAVLDDAGRYDASGGGDVDGLHWVLGDEVIGLDQLKARYYEPGLLPRLLGRSTEALRDVAALDGLAPAPAVSATLGDDDRLVVRLENRGGGIGRVVVRVNGREIAGDARGEEVAADAEEAEIEVPLRGWPGVRPGEANRVEVVAYNGEGYLASRGLEQIFEAPGAASSAPPTLYALVAGVSDYVGDEIDLAFAAKDAEAFADAIRIAGEGLFGRRRTVVRRLGAPGEPPASAAAIEEALAAYAARAEPEDVLVVFLAGHGVTRTGEDDDYYYLAADAASFELADPSVRELVAVSSTELADWMKAVPALKQVLVLDTCASGRVVEQRGAARALPPDQVRALERMKDRVGLYVLSGSAADAPSYEASRYGQGLLTFSLLSALRGGEALREGQYVDVSRWFAHAVDDVPRLATGIGGIQRPMVATPVAGQSFDLGVVKRADRAQIPVATVRPTVTRSVFQDEASWADGLGLAAAVDERLREAARALDAEVAFLDEPEAPEAWRVVGRYGRSGEGIRVQLRIFGLGEAEAPETVALESSTVEGLADAIVEQVTLAIVRRS